MNQISQTLSTFKLLLSLSIIADQNQTPQNPSSSTKLEKITESIEEETQTTPKTTP
jgi:hypothetical protein